MTEVEVVEGDIEDEAPEEPKKKVVKKKPKPKKKGARIITSEVVMVDVGNLTPYKNNPRRGNVKAIAESLEENGQYRPLVVQKTTMEILAGNHTHMAAKYLGWKKVAVTYVDVDNEAAAKIVLADNRTNDLASYDTEALAEVLKLIPDPIGTGYDPTDVQSILSAIEEQNDENLSAVVRPSVELVHGSELVDDVIESDEQIDVTLDGEGSGLVEGDAVVPTLPGEEPEDEDDEEHMLDDDGMTHTVGAFRLPSPEECDYERSNPFHIPPLKKSMLMKPDELPDNLIAWAGSASKDWPDEDQWWLYNVGIDSTSGMKHKDKVIVSFYAYDDYFMNWWNKPDVYVGRMLNTGIKYAVMPDFSQWADDIRIASMQNLYMNYWLARYMQEAGVKVIPNLSWRFCDDWYFDNVVIPAYPKGAPLVGMQMQTFDKDMTQEDRDKTGEFLRRSIEHIQPDTLLLYAGDQGYDFVRKYAGPTGVTIRRLETRVKALGEQAKGRAAKTTL